MVWLWFLFVLAAVGIGAATSARKRRNHAPPPPDLSNQSPGDLEQRDQLEALKQYGTPADAARLKEQGIDLGALGYRPPSEP